MDSESYKNSTDIAQAAHQFHRSPALIRGTWQFSLVH